MTLSQPTRFDYAARPRRLVAKSATTAPRLTIRRRAVTLRTVRGERIIAHLTGSRGRWGWTAFGGREGGEGFERMDDAVAHLRGRMTSAA